jgi:hypothetical protein
VRPLIGRFDPRVQHFFWSIRTVISEGIFPYDRAEFSYDLREQAGIRTSQAIQFIRGHCRTVRQGRAVGIGEAGVGFDHFADTQRVERGTSLHQWQ